MNKSKVLLLLSLLAAQGLHANATIQTNQLGYFTNGPKLAVLTASSADSFSVERLGDNQIVYTGALSESRYYAPGDVMASIADFSTLTDTGLFRVVVKDVVTSLPLRIDNKPYSIALYDVLRSFFFQRVSTAISEEHGGDFARAFGHADTGLSYHADLGKEIGSKRNSAKGWYDAGDYGKYVVNAGVTMGFMQTAALLWPSLISDGFANIPESGNGTSDLIDELRYEVDWLLTMQDDDGGAFFKVTPKSFEATVMPANEPKERFIIGKSTTSSLNLAATLAQSYRVFAPIDSQYADSCLAVAKRAYTWAIEHPSVGYSQGQAGKPYADVSTGSYGDNGFTDEFFWAASELLVATGDTSYLAKIRSTMPNSVGTAGWANPSAHGFFTLALSSTVYDATLQETAKTRIISRADYLLLQISTNPWALHSFGFNWGSNGTVGGDASHLAIAHALTKDSKYIEGSAKIVDYFFGRNPLGISYVTGHGMRSVQRPHSRIMQADGVDRPIPGFIAGGPNETGNSGDNALQQLQLAGCVGALCYTDVFSSYATNEIAINWQAPLAFVLAGLVANYNPDSTLSKPATTTEVLLDLKAVGMGTLQSTPAQTVHAAGATVQIAAQATSPSVFIGYEGSFTGQAADTSIILKSNTVVRALFATPNQQMISNQTFDQDTKGWRLTPDIALSGGNTASGTLQLRDSAMYLAPNPDFLGTTATHVAAMHGPLVLGKGLGYVLEFKARSDDRAQAHVALKRGGSTYLSQTISLGAEFNTYRIPFKVDAPTTSDAFLRFEVGGSVGGLYIDDVSLKHVTGTLPEKVLAIANGILVPGNMGIGRVHGSAVQIDMGLQSGIAELHDISGRMLQSTVVPAGQQWLALPAHSDLMLLTVQNHRGQKVSRMVVPQK